MKKLLTGIVLCFHFFVSPVAAQIVNGSFELNGQPSLEGWQNYGGQLHHEAPPNGGEWSLEISDGCVWGWVYQPLSQIKNNEIWRLSCWARRTGSLGGGEIAWFLLHSRRSLKSTFVLDTLWTQISLVDTFALSETDTVTVLLQGGGGIAGWGGAYFDLVEVEKLGVISSVMNEASEFPKVFALYQNYPNPFSAKGGSTCGGNASTVIRYDLPTPGLVTLEIYNLLGQKVRTLVAEWKPAGSYQVYWQGTDDSGKALPSSVYWYRMTTGRFTDVRKLGLIR